ncbi:hypothetical protein ACF07T_07040 [Streptomyces sp. NPDC015184]|uniref:hypothetical protein n=1 Tax=Streptomyces sp. NPDC015184 TaxID=3364946 RepID=UPI0036FDE015
MSVDARPWGHRPWDCTTFAPPGRTCPACLRPVQPLDRCFRGEIPGAAEEPVVLYRHIDCANPERPSARLRRDRRHPGEQATERCPDPERLARFPGTHPQG